MEKKRKVALIHSITAKIMMLVVGIVVLVIFGCLTNVNAKASRVIGNVNEDYILSMATISADMIDKTVSGEGTTEEYAEILGDLGLEEIDSSYAYLVAPDGTMLYHPTAEKIGQPVENAVVTEVVSKIKAGNIPEDDVVLYDFKGVEKYAAYALTEQKQIVVVSADQAEILAPINNMVKEMILTSLSSMLLCVTIGFFVSYFICKPIKKLTIIISQTAELDFTHSALSEKLCKRKDETGEMAKEVRVMRRNLRDMIRNIDTASIQITDNVDGLEKITETVDRMCSDNSATSEELAAGMEETAATTVNINENIGMIKNGAEEINVLAADGAKTSEEIMERAKNLRVKTIAASTKTMDMYNTVKVKADKAIEDSKAVAKINELTTTIMKISSQTGLLALNASIEAARAGEAGKGFAVVATEIGSLADQTSMAIANISEIVKEVNEAVTNMSQCLEESTDFLENTVVTEYKEFEQVSEQYQEDADVFKDSMENVKDGIGQLSDAIESIAQALGGINETIGEASVGVTDIAEKTSDMVEKTGTTSSMVSECYKCVEELKKIVESFRLE